MAKLEKRLESCAGVQRLLSVYNLVKGKQGKCLLTGVPPFALADVLADLSSRLKALLWIELLPPSDQVIEAILTQEAQRHQLSLSAEIHQFILRHGPRSCRAVVEIVRALQSTSLRFQRKPSILMVRDLLHARNF